MSKSIVSFKHCRTVPTNIIIFATRRRAHLLHWTDRRCTSGVNAVIRHKYTDSCAMQHDGSLAQVMLIFKIRPYILLNGMIEQACSIYM